MPRPDISKSVIHFTRGETLEKAFDRLWVMANEGRLLGGTGMIRGSYPCVCFTEAPLSSLATGFVNADSFSRYSPFGVMVDKVWLFARGGRPVIYQPDLAYADLPESMRWRHVRYDPSETPPVDFTWEREWRIKCDELVFSAADAVLVFPDREWVNRFVSTHDAHEDMRIQMYALILDSVIAEQYRNPCHWRLVSLS